MEQIRSNNNSSTNSNNNATNAFSSREQQDRIHSFHSNIEDITSQLDQMNVDQTNCGNQYINIDIQSPFGYFKQDSMDSEMDYQSSLASASDKQTSGQETNMGKILLVTNVDLSVFEDSSMQEEFESLFRAYDANITFIYFRSFRRVRLDFTSGQSAEAARLNLCKFKLGNTEFRCYPAQIIKAKNSQSISDSCNMTDDGSVELNDSTYLNIPKLTKQFLISPPASPPVGWEPVNESSPCLDVQLISAIANLVPGKMHEIHPGNESQPGIFVEVCEDAQFDSVPGSRHYSRSIPKTPSPAFMIRD